MNLSVFDSNVSDTYDVIIVGYYSHTRDIKDIFNILSNKLNPGGVISFHYYNIWELKPEHSNDFHTLSNIFLRVNYYTFCFPSSPLGQCGFLLLSNSRTKKYYLKPRKLDKKIENSLMFYRSSVHLSSFTIPKFVNRIINFV